MPALQRALRRATSGAVSFVLTRLISLLRLSGLHESGTGATVRDRRLATSRQSRFSERERSLRSAVCGRLPATADTRPIKCRSAHDPIERRCDPWAALIPTTKKAGIASSEGSAFRGCPPLFGRPRRQKISGRTVRTGFAMRFSALLRSICGSNHRATPNQLASSEPGGPPQPHRITLRPLPSLLTKVVWGAVAVHRRNVRSRRIASWLPSDARSAPPRQRPRAGGQHSSRPRAAPTRAERSEARSRSTRRRQLRRAPTGLVGSSSPPTQVR
jgi:hypothetical protein